MKLLAILFALMTFTSSCINLTSETISKEGEIITNQYLSPPEKYSVVEADIPLTYYGVVDGLDLGYQIAPHNVAMKSLEAFYAYHRTGNSSYKDRGFYLADWLLDNATHRDDFVVWSYDYAWPPYDLKSGWTGSLNQAAIMKALSFAYLYSRDEKYKFILDKTLNAFEVDIGEGGLKIIRIDEGEHYVWYPEYVKENPPYVLNGFITVIIRLREYYLISNDKKAEKLYLEGLDSLIHYLPDYDAGNNRSYYDTLGNLANPHYHEMHIAQLDTLYTYTKNPIFKEYKEKWKSN